MVKAGIKKNLVVLLGCGILVFLFFVLGYRVVKEGFFDKKDKAAANQAGDAAATAWTAVATKFATAYYATYKNAATAAANAWTNANDLAGANAAMIASNTANSTCGKYSDALGGLLGTAMTASRAAQIAFASLASSQ